MQRKGLHLTHQDVTSYAIIRYNIRTYRSAGVIEVVQGRQLAQSTLQQLEMGQDSSDRHEGWRYFIERIDLKPGTDPAEATRHRQVELEARESKALDEIKTSMRPSQ